MDAGAVAALNARFADRDRLRVIERDRHAIVAIKIPAATCEIALLGAQPLSWTPAGHSDVFWCAPLPAADSGKAIRGGIPICWPWFGPHATNTSQPQHGLVRTAQWDLASAKIDQHVAQLSFTHVAHGCALRVDISVGASFSMSLSARNTSAAPVTITEALHTYFHVEDVSRASVHGLDGLVYRDNRDGAREKTQRGAIIAAEEVVQVFPRTPDVLTLEDPGLHRRIRIVREGGCSTIVWHPGATVSGFNDIPPERARNFLCVESGNVAPHGITLAPGATQTVSVTYAVERS